jgi:hypothetical protein
MSGPGGGGGDWRPNPIKPKAGLSRLKRQRGKNMLRRTQPFLPRWTIYHPWRKILDRIRCCIPTHFYDTWLRPTRFAGIRDRVLQVCHSAPRRKCVGDKYSKFIELAIHDLNLDFSGVEWLSVNELANKREEPAYVL